MTEYFSSHESSDDDDDSEVAPSKEVSVKPLGELLFRQDAKESGTPKTPEKSDRAEKLHEHQTIWQRVVEQPPEAIEHSLHPENDDDDDEEEGTEKPREKQEKKVPLEHLSHEEERAVLGEYVANRSIELQEEQPEIERGSGEDAAAAANAMLLDKIGEKLDREDASAEAVVDNAYAEAAEEITELDPEELPEEPDKVETGPPAPEIPPAEDEQETPTPAAGAGSGGSTPPPASTPPAAGGGSTPPPPGGYGRPFIAPMPSAGGPGFGPASANTAPNPNTADPNLVTRDQLMYEVRLGQDHGIAAGGLLGYIIGRRRGRIRTEKRLMPVQKKLERQVETLQKTVAGKEHEIRKLATDKVEAVQDAGQRERVIEHLRPQPVAPETLANIPRPEAAPVPFPLQAAGQEQALSPALERARELVKTPEAEEAVPVPKQHIERVERMNQEELLRTSEKVVIDGTPLRTIYEAKRITEPGLRHVLAEFLSGGDVKRALDAELTVKQLTYERDPQVRSGMSAGYPAVQTGGAAGSAAAASAGKHDTPPATQTQQAPPDGSTKKISQPAAAEAESSSEKPLPGQQLIVTGWMVLIVILAFVAAILLVTKG